MIKHRQGVVTISKVKDIINADAEMKTISNKMKPCQMEILKSPSSSLVMLKKIDQR